MNKQYYVAMPDGTPVGPLNREMILQMLRAKQLCPVQLVFTEGMTEWQPINVVFSDVPGMGVFNSREWGPIVAWTICMSSKYATFSGRASRSEYWWFSLANVLVFLLIGVVFFSYLCSDRGRSRALSYGCHARYLLACGVSPGMGSYLAPLA